MEFESEICAANSLTLSEARVVQDGHQLGEICGKCRREWNLHEEQLCSLYDSEEDEVYTIPTWQFVPTGRLRYEKDGKLVEIPIPGPKEDDQAFVLLAASVL